MTLFAHLDVIVTDRKKSHCNLDEKETEQDMSMIICQLHDALDKRYTHNEIKQQLLFFFKQSEAYPEYNFRMIFQHGSSEFKALNEDLRCMIALRKEDIVRDSPRKLRYISQYSEAGRDRSSSAQGETLSGTTPQNALSMVSPNVSPHRVTTPGNVSFVLRSYYIGRNLTNHTRVRHGVRRNFVSDTHSSQALLLPFRSRSVVSQIPEL